jgi:hypothetical protein
MNYNDISFYYFKITSIKEIEAGIILFVGWTESWMSLAWT